MASTGTRLAASTSSSSTHRRKYDLFLSFRGKDTRYEFADTLFTALKRWGIVVFRDDEGLQRGEEINPALEDAIKKSHYAVVIVSPNYTKSKACLMELTVILECKRQGRLDIFPVFYHIDPSNVGKLTTDFEGYLDAQKSYTQDPKANSEYWKPLLDNLFDGHVDLEEMSGSALKKLSDISAWVVRENSYINPIIDEICRVIWARTINESPRDAETLVGMESRAAKVMRLLQLEKEEEVRVVGICGMGGIVDLGQQIAQSSRLLQKKDIVRVLETLSTENSQVKGIVLKLSSKERRTFHLEALSKMANLRVLQITYHHGFDSYDDEMEEFDDDLDHDDEMGEFDEDLDQDDEMEEFDEDLDHDDEDLDHDDEDLDHDDEVEDRDFTRIKWIGDFSSFKLSANLCIMKWENYPLESLPRGSNFVPTNLVELNLSGSCIKQLWDGKKSFPKLRHIDLTGCRELIEIPDMSRVPNLERLKLGYCDCLYTVHSSIGGLKRLRELHLSSCRRLEQFPDVICSECLGVLNFSFCERLKKFPNSLCKWKILWHLDISGTNFTEHPSLSMEFPSLVTFNAGALKMKELPSCIASSKKLSSLSFSCPTYFRFSPCFSELISLKYLTLEYCDFLDEPQLNDYSVGVSNLGKFSSYYSTPLVASSKPLLSLYQLALKGCQTLDELEIRKLISVRYLDLSGNKFRKVPDIVSELSTLWVLYLNSSTSLQELSKLPLSLCHLGLRDCPSLEVFDSQMTELISKEMLQASGCSFTIAYIGFEGKPYKILYLHPKSPAGHSGFHYVRSTATCGPTLEPRITDWFIHRSSSSGTELQIPMDWNSKFKPLMCALMIVYEVCGHDKRESKKRKLDELENSDIGAREDYNSICPEFVCQVQLNEATPKDTFVVCVPEAASVGSHGLWICIKSRYSGGRSIYDPYFSQESKSVERGSWLVSITASNKNVLLKEGGARLVHRDACSELVEVVTTISPCGLDLRSLDHSLCILLVDGPIKPSPRGPYVDLLATPIQH